TTAANNPRIVRTGSHPNSAPGSGNGMVGAAATGRPANGRAPEIAAKIKRRCRRMANAVTSARFAGAYSAKLWSVAHRDGGLPEADRRRSGRPGVGNPASRWRTDVGTDGSRGSLRSSEAAP